MTEREIDTAIDRAVRDLMNVDADAAFRARVTERLQRPARRAWTPRLAVGAVATVAIAVALLWLRTPTPPPATTTEGAASAERAIPPQAPAVAGSNPKATAPVPMARPPASARTTAQPSIRRGTVVAAVAEMPFTSIAPLTAIEPISVEPIANTPITPPEIVVAPLSPITEVQISPLEPRTARD
jgi:hypothetical protein